MISLIAAHDLHRGIGKDNQMPWHLPEELDYFKMMTVGKAVVMGRKTFESLSKKPLKDRTNIVITSSDEYASLEDEYDNLIIGSEFNLKRDKEELISLGMEIMIIGGASIYEQALPYADRLYITKIDGSFECDTFFPEYESSFKRLYCSKEQNPSGPSYVHEIYEKKVIL